MSWSCYCGRLSHKLIGINCSRQSSPTTWSWSWSLATLLTMQSYYAVGNFARKWPGESDFRGWSRWTDRWYRRCGRYTHACWTIRSMLFPSSAERCWTCWSPASVDRRSHLPKIWRNKICTSVPGSNGKIVKFPIPYLAHFQRARSGLRAVRLEVGVVLVSRDAAVSDD